MENKEYVPIDLSKNKRYATVEDDLRDCVSPEIMEEAKRIAAASTVSSALAHMRVKAGISQNMMAAALDCSQPRISAIESATNDKMSMAAVLKYVEVTGFPSRFSWKTVGLLPCLPYRREGNLARACCENL